MISVFVMFFTVQNRLVRAVIGSAQTPLCDMEVLHVLILWLFMPHIYGRSLACQIY